MTKEEQIKQKAEEWMRNNSERCTKENMNGYDFAIATCIAVTTEATKELEKENAELKSIADFQTSSNMDRYFQLKRLQEENKKTFNDWIEACNKYGEVNLKLTKAKEIINDCVRELQNILFYKMRNKERIASTLDKAEQFLKDSEGEK